MPAEPYYRQIMTDIRARIASGEWPPGHRLPTTDELVEMYRAQMRNDDLSYGTVRRAVSTLIERDELRGQQGKGVFVAGGEAG